MVHHPHVHIISTGGGLSLDGCRWVKCRDDFFLPAQVLSRLFRGKFLAALREAYRNGQLILTGRLSDLIRTDVFNALCDKLSENDWVVYAKKPFAGPEVVLKYLARYTHRIAIANRRIVKIEAGKVHFRYRRRAPTGVDYTVMNLDCLEFVRRFLLHVLPKGYTRIRHYGLLAPRHKTAKLALCRCLIPDERPEATGELNPPDDNDSWERCPACKSGTMKSIETIKPNTTGITLRPIELEGDTS